MAQRPARARRAWRVVPELVGKLTGLGYAVAVEPGAGAGALHPDDEYVAAGAEVVEEPWLDADLVVSVNPLDPSVVRRLRAGTATVSFLPVNQSPRPGRRPARLRGHVVRDGAGAAHLPRPVDGRAVVAGAGLRLPLRDRRGRPAAPVLPAEHDRRRHRPARRGRRARRRRRRAAGDRHRQAARRRRQGVRRPGRRRGGDPLDGRRRDRARARDPRGRRRLRPRDDRGPRRTGSASCSRRTSPPPTR